MPGMLSRWSLSSLPSDGVRQRRSATSVGPAEPRQRRSVLSRLCQSPAASPPRPVLVSLRTPGDGGFLWICEGTTHHGSQEDKMATTATTTPNQPVTYSLLVIFTVDPSTDEHLQDQQSIRDEAESWLTSLDATVHGVNIRKAD
jgi:hypothetical protein